MSTFRAIGFPPSTKDMCGAFVSIRPEFCTGVNDGVSHVSTVFIMSPDAARELSADLLKAADLADPPVDSMPEDESDELTIHEMAALGRTEPPHE
jgi:hypothetical protein